MDDVAEIRDFTILNEWEQLVSELEQCLLEWGLHRSRAEREARLAEEAPPSRLSYNFKTLQFKAYQVEFQHQVLESDFQFSYHPELELFSDDSHRFYAPSHFQMLSCYRQFPMQSRFGVNEFLLLKVGEVGLYELQPSELDLILSAGIAALDNMNVALPVFVSTFQAKYFLKGHQRHFALTTQHRCLALKEEKLSARSSVAHIVERIQEHFGLSYNIAQQRHSFAANVSFYVFRQERTKPLFLAKGDFYDGFILQASLLNATPLAPKLHFFDFDEFVQHSKDLTLAATENAEFKAREYNTAKPMLRLLEQPTARSADGDFFFEDRIVKQVFSHSLRVPDNRFTSLLLEFMEELGLEPCFESLPYRIAEAVISLNRDFEVDALDFAYIWRQVVAQLRLIWDAKDVGLNILARPLNESSIDAFVNTVALSVHHSQLVRDPGYRKHYLDDQQFRLAGLVTRCEDRERAAESSESDTESFYDALSQIGIDEEEKQPARPRRASRPQLLRVLSPVTLMNSEQLQGLLKIKQNLEGQPELLEEFLTKNLLLLWAYFRALLRATHSSRKLLRLFTAWVVLECESNDSFNLIYGELDLARFGRRLEQGPVVPEEELVLVLEKDVLFAIDYLEALDLEAVTSQIRKCLAIDTLQRMFENSKLPLPQNVLFYELLSERFLKFVRAVELDSAKFGSHLHGLADFFAALLSLFYKFPSLASADLARTLISELRVPLTEPGVSSAILSMFRMFCPNPFKYELVVRWLHLDQQRQLATPNRAFLQVAGRQVKLGASLTESAI